MSYSFARGPAFKGILLWLLCFGLLFGQSERGTISGTVRDTTGAVIPGAKVTITNTATNVVNNSTSNQVGEFTILSLQVGRYNVEVSKEGFRPAEIKGLTVDAGSN